MTIETDAPNIATAKDHPRDVSGKRNRSILTAGLSALMGKGITVLINAAVVPITVRYLGAESYGLWITISSTIAMFLALDIGISSTLTNLISEAFARDDKQSAAEYFATAFWSISAISALLAVIGWLAWPYLHWAAILHVQNASVSHQAAVAMAAAFIVFLFSLPIGLVAKVLAGYQEQYAANLFMTGGNVLGLLAVLAVVYLHGDLPWLVGAYAGSTVLANAICFAWMCFIHKPWLKPWPSRMKTGLISRILHSGIQFFAIQVAGLVVFCSDNLVIAHYLTPAQVTPYSVTWRLVSYVVIAQTFMFPALWPAFSEAWSSGQIDWIRRTYSRVRRITVTVLAVGCGAILLVGRQFIRIWAGPAAVPSFLLVALMCIWIAIYAITTNQSCLMGATYRVGRQAVCGILAAIANVVLSIMWVKTLGSSGVILGTIVSYLLFVMLVQTLEVRRILRGDFLPAHHRPVQQMEHSLDPAAHLAGDV